MHGIKLESELGIVKRKRKSLHITENLSNDISSFISLLDSKSLILQDKRPNTTVKDLENFIKSIYDVPGPECIIMDGEEYSGDRSLHDLAREKYLYIPFQSLIDVEIKLFTMLGADQYVETLRNLESNQLKSLERKYVDKIKYGVLIITFHKKRPQGSLSTTNLQAYIPQILRGNTCDDSNEEKIDYLMRHRFKSPPMNIKQNILNFKQIIENELLISLDNVDVFDLCRFYKLPEQQPLSTFITRTDYTDYILVFRFKQMPKENKICIVINQVIPIQISQNENIMDAPKSNSTNLAPPKDIYLSSLDTTYSKNVHKKELWTILETFSHGCKIEDPRNWTQHEVKLWLNYIRTTMFIVPVTEQIRIQLISGNFYNTIHQNDSIYKCFRINNSDSNINEKLQMLRFVRHCELLIKYNLFYQFKHLVSSDVHQNDSSLLVSDSASSTSINRPKGPLGRSKARREILVSQLGGRREVQLLTGSQSLMDTRLGQSLYSGRNTAQATTVSQHQHRKWTFLLRCLLMPDRATQLAWVDYDCSFRLVEQDIIARLYGNTCNKPDMTYDKLSRGLRYDRSGLIEKVDKNYCWRFLFNPKSVLGLVGEKIIQKMYKYYEKRNQVYPADLLLKENLNKKNAEKIGPLTLYVPSLAELERNDRQTLPDTDWKETTSSVGYMSTDRRINFWTDENFSGPLHRFNKRLNQGRLVHSVMPNEPEFVALTALNGGSSSKLEPLHTNNAIINANLDVIMFQVDPILGSEIGTGSCRNRNDSLAISDLGVGSNNINVNNCGNGISSGAYVNQELIMEGEIVTDDTDWNTHTDNNNLV